MKKNFIHFLTRIILPGLIALLIMSAGFLLLNRKNRNDNDKRKQHEIMLNSIHREAPAATMNPDAEAMAADEPDRAAFHEFLMTFDPATGKLPSERLFGAMEATRLLAAGESSRISWQEHPSNMGGRTRMIMYDPNDPTLKKVWAGGVTGGLWYNNDITDAYSPWVPVGEFWNTLAIRCMAYDPQQPQTFFVGTGEVETAMQTYRESSGLGYGIGRSDDGGETWQHVSGTQNFAYVTDIVVRVENSVSVIYAGVASGLYKGSQHQSSPSDGLFRSVNGGATWQQVLPVITGSTVPYCVSDIALGSDNRLYVGTRPNLDGEGGAVLLYSNDGINWNVNRQYQSEILSGSYPIPGRVVLATTPSDPNVVYALIASGRLNTANGFNYFYCYHILRSSNKGVSWVKKALPSDLTSGSNFATIAWHALDVAVDPNNANRVFVGGLDVHVSGNGGTSWTRISDWALMYYGGGDQYIHADQHVILYKPGSSSEVLFGTDGGVFYTSQGTSMAPFIEEHNENFSTLQFYTCAIHPEAGANLFCGGLQDNGTLFYSGTPLTIFDMVTGGDGAYCFIDPLNPSLLVTSVYYNKYYVFVDGNPDPNIIDQWTSGTFINPADLDHNLKKLYCNAVDYGGNYQDQILRLEYLEDGTIGTFVDLNTGTTVLFTAVKYSPYSPPGKTTLYVGSESGRLFRVAEAQTDLPVVTEIGSTAFPAAAISCIALGKSEDTLMVTFSNYGVTSVWKSFNGGQAWQNAEGNLPDMPVRWALFHPQNDLQALIATETGAWECLNLMQTPVVWMPANYGMANVRIDMLRVRKSDNTVLAATHGRGFFTMTWDLLTGRAERQAEALAVYPNPSTGQIFTTMMNNHHGEAILSVTDMEGKQVHREVMDAPAGRFTRQFDLTSLPKGSYVLSMETTGGKNLYKKILIQ